MGNVCSSTRRGENIEDAKISFSRDQTFKVIFLGCVGAGKTSLVRRLHGNVFSPSVEATIGVIDMTQCTVILNQRTRRSMMMDFWDTAGMESNSDSMTPQYFRKANAFVLVVDSTCVLNIEVAQKLIMDPLNRCLDYNRDCFGIIVFNKYDLVHENSLITANINALLVNTEDRYRDKLIGRAIVSAKDTSLDTLRDVIIGKIVNHISHQKK
jgi:small GTP-binding protein